jgi:hypothetical protein
MRHGKDADRRHPWRNIETVEDVRVYVKHNQNSGIAVAWENMLTDMDVFGAECTVDDFLEEADIQAADGNT